jgi:hypothetical protein
MFSTVFNFSDVSGNYFGKPNIIAVGWKTIIGARRLKHVYNVGCGIIYVHLVGPSGVFWEQRFLHEPARHRLPEITLLHLKVLPRK